MVQPSANAQTPDLRLHPFRHLSSRCNFSPVGVQTGHRAKQKAWKERNDTRGSSPSPGGYTIAYSTQEAGRRTRRKTHNNKHKKRTPAQTEPTRATKQDSPAREQGPPASICIHNSQPALRASKGQHLQPPLPSAFITARRPCARARASACNHHCHLHPSQPAGPAREQGPAPATTTVICIHHSQPYI